MPLDKATLAAYAAEVDAAEARVGALRARGDTVLCTPLEYSAALTAAVGGERTAVYLKLEALQPGGSFKIRGAVNKLTALGAARRAKGVVLASTGNHALACVLAARALNDACGDAAAKCKVTVVMPNGTVASKRAPLEAAYLRDVVELRFAGDDCVESEAAARELAAQRGAEYVSPYNDVHVMAGQGTLAREIIDQLEARRGPTAGAAAAAAPDAPPVDVVYVSVGGGGLIGGVAVYLKARYGDRVQVVGVSPRASCVMHESVKAGRVLDLPSEPTLSDGTAGGIESASVTFDVCHSCVDRWLLVDEPKIAAALRFVVEQHQLIVEGAAALCVAALLDADESARVRDRRVVLLMCGRRIGADKLLKVLGGEYDGASATTAATARH